MKKPLPSEIHDAVSSGAIPIIMGPTASGKSALAMTLAEELNGEIISADSMQFYRGLDIGTAKPSRDEQKLVRHHLIDTMDISEKSDIYRFKREAEAAINDIKSRGRIPVIAGGSGLYLKSLVNGLDDLPAEQSLRDRLDEMYDNDIHFHELQDIMRLEQPLDFASFCNHKRRLIRAREVFVLTGKEMTHLHNVRKASSSQTPYAQFTIVRERDELWERIERRTSIMLETGWIEEAASLIKDGLLESPTAWQALGYAVIGEYLEGKFDYASLVEKIVIATRQYARRQRTWFRTQHPAAMEIHI